MDSITDLEQDVKICMWNTSDWNGQIWRNLSSKCIQYPRDIPYGGVFFVDTRHTRDVPGGLPEFVV